MAKNGTPGDGHRNGAVKERSQTYNPKTNQWVKRNANTGQFMDVKQACIETEKDIVAENSLYKLKIEETNDTKEIAGYKCHRLKVTMVDDPSKTFDAYYTKEMQVDHVNSLSPYSAVKGMLMQYRLKKMGLELQFTAKSVKCVEVPDNTFEVPAYFKIVSKEEMAKFFSGLQ